MNESNSQQPGPGVTLRDHSYDGIQEYDQKLPNWWLFTLYIMIVFFICYWIVYYNTTWLKSDAEKIDIYMAKLTALRESELEKMVASLTDQALWEKSREPAIVEQGKAIFLEKCQACHGPDLSGFLNGVKLPGEPLNDATWKYGGEPLKVFNTVTNGSPNLASGMIPWKTQLSTTDIMKVVSFVLSHHELPK